MGKATTEAPRQGLIIVDHGTRDPAANAPLARLAERVAKARPAWRVEHAHMELAEPRLGDSIDRLVSIGVRQILIHLHFLGEGFHVRETLPGLIEAARERHPEITIRTTAPLGEDERIAQIVIDRLDAQSSPERDK